MTERETKAVAEAICALLYGESNESSLKKKFYQYVQAAKDVGVLSQVINFPIQRYYGRTLVHAAAVNGLPEYLRFLLENGGDPNKTSFPNDLCQTPLHLAAQEGYTSCIDVLLKHGAQIRVENSRRMTPVELARGKVKCEVMFKKAIAKIEIPNRTPDQLQRVKDLHGCLDDGGNLDSFKSLYLSLPEHEKDLGARWTDWFQYTLLYRAVDKKCEDAVRFLLSMSKSFPLTNLGNGSTPLLAACFHSDISLVTCLINHSPMLCFIADEHTGLSPLHICCSRGDTGIVQKILECLTEFYEQQDSPTNLNMKDQIGRTPLFNACYHGRVKIAEFLLDFKRKFPGKININLTESGGRTPLHAAVSASRYSKEIVSLLLQHSDLLLDVEARPSSRANKYLLKLLKKSHQQIINGNDFTQGSLLGEDAVLAAINRNGGSQPGTQRDYPISPPVTCSPLDSPYSDDHDVEMGVLKGGATRRSIDSPLSPKFQGLQRTPTFSSVSDRSRPSTPNTPPLTPPSSDVVTVYQSESGRLEITKKVATTEAENTSFNKMSITPLAEACIFHNKDVVKLLLDHGASDKNAVATQICSLIKRTEILHLILSRECRPLDDEGFEEESGTASSYHHLQWKGKHLQNVSGLWLSKDSEFLTANSQEDTEERKVHCQQMKYKSVSYSSIFKVSLSHNHLLNVPLELFQLPNVTSIDLSGNNLISLPEPSNGRENGWACDSLSTLNLSNNSLQILPSCIWVLPALAQLTVSRNKLVTLTSGYDPSLNEDEELSPTLVEVNLADNELKRIPDFLFKFEHVTKISLANNRIDYLPDAMWYQVSLQELNVCNNDLECLPLCEEDELASIHNQEEAGLLDIATPLSDMTVTLREDLKYQASIRSKRTTITSDRASFKIKKVTNVDTIQPEATIEQSCDYSNLALLNISNNKFVRFPTGLPCLAPNLLELNISNNSMQFIDVIFLPQTLRKLIAKKCMVQRIGNTLMESQLKSVRRKCFNSSEAALCLHRSHSSLQYLQTLDLTDNNIGRIQLIQHPPLGRKTQDVTLSELEYQPNVTILNLLYPSLEGLNLTRNRLFGELNPNIGRQTQLKWIRLSGNEGLERIPLQIAYLKNVRSTFTELRIQDLPNLVEPPAEYQKDNVPVGQILTYLRSKLKHSVPYRTMKLFLIGRGERGKTTLLRRLKETGPGETERTEGIDIGFWDCRGKTGLFKGKREPIRFLAWDFAGQDVYHSTHQLFYSRRALYLALFRLSDGMQGIDELDPWLRNVQLRAPGCIVIVVGTHLDRVTDSEKQKLEQTVGNRFCKKKEYPQVVGCISVSSVNRVLTNNIDNLRQFIYDVASKLKVTSKDGDNLEYKKDLKDSDPHALLNQQIPASFLRLQEEIYKVYKEQPKMTDVEFQKRFGSIFEDEEEFNEAVHYLSLQGTLLHFEDPGLRKLYFLDPEWLAKLMACLINPASANNSSFVDGRISIEDLFQLFRDGPFKDSSLHEQDQSSLVTSGEQDDDELSMSYLQLLQKFELALQLNERDVLIPPLLPEEGGMFPQPDESLEDVQNHENIEEAYQPPIRRFWLSNYIPEGFWPRLICRVYKDYQINTVLKQYADSPGQRQFVEWKTWKKGMIFMSRGRTLVALKLLDNITPSDDSDNESFKLLKGKYRIEVLIFVPEMIRITQELLDKKMDLDDADDSLDEVLKNDQMLIVPFNVTGHATKVMVSIANHIESLSSWFSGMVSGETNGYTPCWKCSAGIKQCTLGKSSRADGGFIYSNDRMVYSLAIDKNIVPACEEKDLFCPLHKSLKTVHQAPDLVFWDLKKFEEMNCEQKLRIFGSDLLGRGGFGFVCKGELTNCSQSSEETTTTSVAVKVFINALGDRLDSSSVNELISMSRSPENLLHAYKEIRQEVSFLAGLDHSNITKLQGVKTKPTLCLILELAPKKSLRTILKEYREEKIVLEPLTLKQSANQIAEGLAYLHKHRIVHLDVKSPNVLVWYFPSAKYNKEQRVLDAGNVWLKLADYGISQVAPTMLMRMGSSPIGTPGYMAPEMFESTGQEVSADKIDVFAYGMVLYELISQQVPFGKQPVQKRNHDVIDGKRPPIGSQEKHSPLCIQDLMRLCWSQDSSHRPTMKQCVKWTSSIEFDRLRTEITLGSCNSIACACVSRIEPEYETEWFRDNSIQTEMDGSLLTKEEIERFGLDSHFQKLMTQATGSIIERQESQLITSANHVEEELTRSDDSLSDQPTNRRDSIFVTSTSLEATKSVTNKLLRKKDRHSRGNSPALTRSHTATVDTSYSQIWMCGRDRKKGLLAVFILPDNQKNVFRFFGYIGDEEIQVLCPIRNSIWMGTSKGSIRIIHAPTLSIKYSSRLCEGEGLGHSPILKILHVEQEKCVLVSTHSSDIWCFHDRLIGDPYSLIKRQQILMNDREDCGPVYDMTSIVVDGKVRVWGTMDNNVLIELVVDKGVWSKTYHQITPPSHHMKVCSYIVCCNFKNQQGTSEHHLWISYRNKAGLVCLDARSKKQINYINCTEALKTPKSSATHSVNTILGEGKRLLVGTLDGLVAVFDSQTTKLISCYSWHEEKVRSLLILPEQIRHSICAEVNTSPKDSVKNKSSSFVKGSHEENKHYLPNDAVNGGPLIASIGNGRRGFNIRETATPTHHRPRSHTRISEDITLLIWHS